MIKPLSVRKYYQHNQRKVNMVFTITFFSIFLQYALLIYTTSMLNLYQGVYLEYFKSIAYIDTLNSTREYRQSLINLLNKQSSVAKVIPFETISTSISGVGEAWIICIKPQEIKSLMQIYKLHLIQGQLPTPGSREAVLHWRIAANQGLKIGDHFGKKFSPNGLLDGKYQLTGLLGGKCIGGFSDLKTYDADYHTSEDKASLLIVPQPGKLTQVKHYLENLIPKTNQVYPATAIESSLLNFKNDVLLLINIIYLIITGIVTICAGFLFYLYFYQRRAEFGLLEALGHTRQMIIGRTFREILEINLLGLGSALGAALLCGWALNRFALQAKGLTLALWDHDYLFRLLSTPLFIILCSIIPVWRMLKKVDPISIITGVD
jgi:ABC-type lipoprotein release transport system permease subunit